MQKALLTFFISLSSFVLFSQEKITISGLVKDKETNELIIGAKIVCDSTNATLSDIDGKYTLTVNSNSSIQLTASFVGYENLIVTVKASSIDITKDLYLETFEQEIEEVKVTADIAKTRETPIAFSKISSKQIAEELGTRDLPMILNSTPGAYATEQGGGAGDARVSIRGFSHYRFCGWNYEHHYKRY